MPAIFKSSLIDAPIAEVWATIRDFNGLPQWHPVIASSYIEDDLAGDQIGCIRNFNLQDGSNIREQLLAMSDVQFFYTYTMLESPLALENYLATLRLRPITDSNQTYAEWEATFECTKEQEENLIKLVAEGVFQKGFDALKTGRK